MIEKRKNADLSGYAWYAWLCVVMRGYAWLCAVAPGGLPDDAAGRHLPLVLVRAFF